MENKTRVRKLLKSAVDRVNGGISKTLTARRSAETPPMDPRHLTDTRTRVSTLLEYSLAYEMNILLDKEGDGCSISAVLWNVFPDLYMRDTARMPIIGFEVKALHTAAEEKSANLSTPLHLINKEGDFVVIIIWTWQREDSAGVSITYPHIQMVEIFDAYLLAQIRDYSWLLSQGNRIKGIDISTPIISPDERPKGPNYKAEEGNMGKLMRIDLHPDIPTTIPNYAEIRAESGRYADFKQSVLILGLRATFQEICDLQRASDVSIDTVTGYPDSAQILGCARLPNKCKFLLLAGRSLTTWIRDDTQKRDHDVGTLALWLSSKLNWSIIRRQHSNWETIAEGAKPDSAYEQISMAMK